MHVKHPIITNIAVCILSIIFALILAEIFLPFLRLKGLERFVFIRRMPIIQYIYGEYHPTIEYILKPNIQNAHIKYKNYTDYYFSTNKHGFRGANWDFSSKRKNVVVLGDSFAFGWGVGDNETFSVLLEEQLKKIDPNFQVINLAQSGFFLDQILNTYTLYGKKFNPELIIYLYCYNDPLLPPQQENDQFDITNYRANITKKDFTEQARRNNVNIWRFERFYKSLYIYAFYQNYIIPMFYDQKTPGPARRAWKQRYRHTFTNLLPPNPPSQPVKQETDEQKYLWYGLNFLNTISNKKPIILMDTSLKMTIHMKDSPNSDRWILRDFAASTKNVTFLDFESDVRKRSDGVSRFLYIDDHWNVKGHELAAKLLFDTLRKSPLTGVQKCP